MASQVPAVEGRTSGAAAAGPFTQLAATGGAVVTVILVATTLLLWVGRGFENLPVSFGRTAIGMVGLVASSLCYAVFGALLAIRIPRNPIGWLFLAAGFSLGTMLPVNILVTGATEALRPADPDLVLVAWARTTFATPLVLTLLIVAGYLFPDGRPVAPAWWGGIAATVAGGTLLATSAALNPEGLVTYPSIPNPLAMPAALAPLVRGMMVAAVALLLAAMVLAMASLGIRYRRGSALLKTQLRWILLAVAVTVTAAVPFVIVRYVVPVGDTLGEFSAMLAQLGSCSFPIAAVFAVTRYRLYDIDALIGHTLVYVPLTGLLAGLYTAALTLFQRLFVAVTGEQSDMAIVLTTLVLAAGFTPLRAALEVIVARRFKPAAPGGASPNSTEPGGAFAPAASGSVPSPSSPTAIPDVVAAAPLVSVLGTDANGNVSCPREGGPVPLARCLTCPYLVGMVRAPDAAALCTWPASARG